MVVEKEGKQKFARTLPAERRSDAAKEPSFQPALSFEAALPSALVIFFRGQVTAAVPSVSAACATSVMHFLRDT